MWCAVKYAIIIIIIIERMEGFWFWQFCKKYKTRCFIVLGKINTQRIRAFDSHGYSMHGCVCVWTMKWRTSNKKNIGRTLNIPMHMHNTASIPLTPTHSRPLQMCKNVYGQGVKVGCVCVCVGFEWDLCSQTAICVICVWCVCVYVWV